MRGYLQRNSTNLNDTDKLDQFIGGCIHSMKLFQISCEDRKSSDPVMLQRFLQGTLINTLTVYLHKLGLPNEPDRSAHHSSRYSENSDTDSENEQKPKTKLNKSKRTTTLRRNGPA